MTKVYLIHGWDGHPHNHWFPWLTLELKARGFEVFAPAMPDPANPKVEEWVKMIKEWVGKPDQETFFIGHSLGCISTIKYLETLKAGQKIGGCVFVAGFSGNIDIDELKDFYSNPINLDKVKSHTKNFTTIFSDNDDVVPFEVGLEFAKQLGAKVIIEKSKGHFCKGDGVESLQSALNALLAF